MKLCRCPVCHSDIHLDQLLEDDAGREMLGIIAGLKGNNARALVSYIGLFRPEKSGLSNSRAVKLMREVLALYQPSPLLAHALTETVNAVMKNRREGKNAVALNNHNYLKKVYEGAKPLFAVVRNEGKVDIKTAEQQAEEKRIADIQYIERYAAVGQLEIVKNMPEYATWLAWRVEKENDYAA
ncbi:hypothetical protein BKG95_10300 [Rodentibacter pneumotropicus]|uniref:Uncharacterized protein n=1 Tax=Rodentibacter pneumotropicus TaxID=758 RepID=A0AAW5LCB3_9PAST|nr:hypothetical protein [Rodentibacter pneumotropicus]MCQ9121279.1 hypothetical protein [Rodentibacter pneumotropicus]OOF66590.1 hypothetical protein BKG95_10300 [Rodentibacter pneumotropicus]